MEQTFNNLAEEVLMHHGVLGMKWGIRRYQNKDGSLTAAGRRRLEKSDRKKVKDARFESKIADRMRKDSSVMLKTAEKRWNKVKDKKDSNKKEKLREKYEFAKDLDSDMSKKQKEARSKALKMTEQYVNAYGDKKLKDIKFNKDGSIGDGEKTVQKILVSGVAAGVTSMFIPISPVIAGMAAGQYINRTSSIGIGDKRFREELKARNKAISDNQKSASKDFKENTKGVKSDFSKKEQKRNLDELAKEAKRSGYDKAQRALDNPNSDTNAINKAFENAKKSSSKSKLVKEITSSQNVKSAKENWEQKLNESTKAQNAVENYFKKQYPNGTNKREVESFDPIYSDLQTKADKAYDAQNSAWKKVEKTAASELSKYVGSNPNSKDIAAIRLMIEQNL